MLLVEELKLPNGKVHSIKLGRGESKILSGKNGVGKSLFLKGIAALYPLIYKTFRFEQTPLTELDLPRYRSQVLYLPTSTIADSTLSVNEFMNSPLQLNVYKDHFSTFDYESHLGDIATVSFKHLSSGQKQFLAILRALTLRPKILLLDEPTAHLDQEKTILVENLLMEWSQKTNGSFIFISHDENQRRRLGLEVIEL